MVMALTIGMWQKSNHFKVPLQGQVILVSVVQQH